ncbi:S9 family peptidase [Sphingobium sp. H39-3-25]|uniref:S9 family peptidase n=1 Tax=Sphingobium arseniciresistens TaxID=3030834 RepID=UPI0023B9EA77|nr:S9 family peptidase [Sphingobium arseniciresistens]
MKISPDGAWLAWCAPSKGVANIWLAPREHPEQARLLTNDQHRGITTFMWAEDAAHILYSQDRDGDEIVHLHAIRVSDGETRDLTPIAGARGFVVATSPRHPGAVVAAINDRVAGWPDLWRIDIATGERQLLCRNDGMGSFLLDDDFTVRIASRQEREGGFTLMRPSGQDGWTEWLAFDPEEARTSALLGLDAQGQSVFLKDSRGRDTAALVEIDVASGREAVLVESPLADVGGMITDRRSYRPVACYVTVERPVLTVIDPAIQSDIDRLGAIEGLGEWSITARSREDRWWTIVSGSDQHPAIYWLYDREAGTLLRLFDGRLGLRDAPLAPMRALTITARDGQRLVSYLTLPLRDEAESRPERPLPLILLVHGGPWTRDGFGYNSEHQWLANRGYAVLSVNFRGSSGFGKAFMLAGDRQWGRRMDDDLEDAVAWAIDESIADPMRLAIMGTSYGGYAVLSALTRQPDRYACGVDIVGPSNLETLLLATPPQWEALRATLHRAVGDHLSEEGRADLHERSPLHRAGEIKAPLLIGQGGNDPRVPLAEAEQMVTAMRASAVPVDYAFFPDEGHGFARPANAIAFRILVEQFFARHLGGRAEPVVPGECAETSLRFEGEAELSASLEAGKASEQSPATALDA